MSHRLCYISNELQTVKMGLRAKGWRCISLAGFYPLNWRYRVILVFTKALELYFIASYLKLQEFTQEIFRQQLSQRVWKTYPQNLTRIHIVTYPLR